MGEERNFIVLTLRSIGIIIIILGLYLAYYIGNILELSFIFKTYTQIIALIVGVTAVACGIVILGRAEQIKMLQKIYANVSKCTFKRDEEAKNSNSN